MTYNVCLFDHDAGQYAEVETDDRDTAQRVLRRAARTPDVDATITAGGTA